MVTPNGNNPDKMSSECCLHQSQNTLYLTCGSLGLFLEASKNVLNAKMIVLVNDASFVNKQTDVLPSSCIT